MNSQKNTIFLYYHDDTLCYNRNYFHNSQHFNSTGADIFSGHLANDLKTIIKN